MALIGDFQLQALIGLGHQRALLIDLLLRRAVGLLGQRQTFLTGFQLHRRLLGAFVSEQGELLPARLVGVVAGHVLFPLGFVGGQLRQAVFILVTRFATMADLGFQSGHFGADLIVFGLRRLHAICRREMALAGGFKRRFRFPQGSRLRFEFIDRLTDALRQTFLLGPRLVAPQEPQKLLLAGQFRVVFAVLTSDRSLRFEALHLQREFAADVLDAGQILARIREPTLRFLAPLLVFGDPGRLFEKHPQFVRSGLDDARDGSLSDDRVGTRPEAGTKKKIGDVLAPDVQVVDVILGLAVARQQALDRQLAVLRPLTADPPQRIVKNELHRRP